MQKRGAGKNGGKKFAIDHFCGEALEQYRLFAAGIPQ